MKKKPTAGTIKDWATDDRPREKMLEKGRDALSNAELIAILLGSGNKDETAVDLARHILNDANNSLIELSQLSIKDLTQYKGIGTAKAVTIAAALELGQRKRSEAASQKKMIGNSHDAFEYFVSKISDLTYEQFWVLLMDAACNVIKIEKIGDGGLNIAAADPKMIFKAAIENHAAAIMLCHNHPSNDLEPGNLDIKMTKSIVESGKILDIKVLDHIIIGTGKDYYSFADRRKLGV